MVVPAERAFVDGTAIAVAAQKRPGLCAEDVSGFVFAGRTRSGEEVLVTERHWVNVDHFLTKASTYSSVARRLRVSLICPNSSLPISSRGVA